MNFIKGMTAQSVFRVIIWKQLMMMRMEMEITVASKMLPVFLIPAMAGSVRTRT